MARKKPQHRRTVLKVAGVATLSAIGVTSVGANDSETITTTHSDGHEHGHAETSHRNTTAATTHSERHGHGTTETGHHTETTTTSGHGHGSGQSTDNGHSKTTEREQESGHGHNDGHGGGSGQGHSGGISEPTAHATVAMNTNGSILDVLTGGMSLSKYFTENRNHFHPHIVHVKKGGTVTWKDESGRHAVVAYHPSNHGKPNRIPKRAKPWDSDALTGGEFSHTFDVEGVYDYYCPPHEPMGMIGSVVVGNPDVSNQLGLKPPSRSLPSRAQTKLADLNEQTREALNSTGGHR